MRTDDIYGLAAILDPNFGLNWVDDRLHKQEWIDKLVKCLLSDGWNPNSSIHQDDISPDKGWFNFNNKDRSKDWSSKLDQYFNIVEVTQTEFRFKTKSREIGYMETIDQCKFWKKLSTNPDFELLSQLARRLFAIPASSASIERVLCGFIMRPHRNRLSDKLDEQLFFLRANKKLLMDFDLLGK